jgi:hypothetical protein
MAKPNYLVNTERCLLPLPRGINYASGRRNPALGFMLTGATTATKYATTPKTPEDIIICQLLQGISHMLRAFERNIGPALLINTPTTIRMKALNLFNIFTPLY